MLKNKPEKDYDYIDKELMPKISRTFDATLRELPDDLMRSCILGYSICRIIDIFEDSNIDERDRIILMNAVVSSFSSRDVEAARNLQPRLAKVPIKKKGYVELVKNFSSVVSASEILGEGTNRLISECIRHMADGLSNPTMRNIETFEDHHRYCHYAAGVVGYFITKDMHLKGYIDGASLKRLMPSDMDNKPDAGVNPAHDFATALQLTNNIKDFHDDYGNEIFRWPFQLLKARGLKYADIADPGISGRKLDRAMDILGEQIEDAKRFFPSAALWIDNIPYAVKGKSRESIEGIKRSWGIALALSAATLKRIYSERFFTEEGFRKLTHEQYNEVCNSVRNVVRGTGKIKDLVDRLF